MYLPTRALNIDSTTAEMLRRLGENLTAAGVKLPADVAKANTVAGDRLAHIAQVRADTASGEASKTAARNLADGKGNALEVIAAASAAANAAQGNPTGPAATILNNAQTLVARELHTVWKDHGDDWITKTLRPVVDKYVTTITSADSGLVPMDHPTRTPTAADHLLYDPTVAEAWGNLKQIHTVADNLRALRIIPSSLHRRDLYEYTGDPGARDEAKPTITWFIHLNRNDHGPGIYTEAEILTALEEAA